LYYIIADGSSAESRIFESSLRALRVARRMRVSRRGCNNDEEKEEATATTLMTNVRYLAN